MKRDLVCGIFIEATEALRLEYHGNTYYFCSRSCKREFEDRPDEYAEPVSTMMLDAVVSEPLRTLATAMQEGKGPIGH
jgi:YHS domain-containing protein